MHQWFIHLHSKSCCICIISDFQRLQTGLNCTIVKCFSLFIQETHTQFNIKNATVYLLVRWGWRGWGQQLCGVTGQRREAVVFRKRKRRRQRGTRKTVFFHHWGQGGNEMSSWCHTVWSGLQCDVNKNGLTQGSAILGTCHSWHTKG